MLFLLLVIVIQFEMRGRHHDEKARVAGFGGDIQEFWGDPHHPREHQDVFGDLGQGTRVTLAI